MAKYPSSFPNKKIAVITIKFCCEAVFWSDEHTVFYRVQTFQMSGSLVQWSEMA